ncbi:MAG: cytochrome ubiquinol oxidase subunit I, partial [Rickettsiales bacterium]|nr:cytochrome ubiquinol oxidase subunit I [Rickettsiales bacterium]
VASGLTTAFLIAGISSYRLLRGDHSDSVIKSFKTAIIMAALLMPLQILAGHEHGINTKEYQPAKLAAMEGAWETQKGAPLVLFGIPNEETRTNDYAIEIPYLASIIVTHSMDGEIQGLNDFEKHPPVKPVFFSFRIMVGIGMLMLLVSFLGCYFLFRKQTMPKWYLRVLVAMTFSGTIATIAGWYVTEIGRQPWLVHGVMTTQEALGSVSGGMVLSTLLVYLGVYLFLTIAYVSTLFYMARKAGDGSNIDPEKQVIIGGERHTIITKPRQEENLT